MSKTQFTRRAFFKAVGASTASLYVFTSATGTHSWLAPHEVLAADLGTLTAPEAKVMLAMTRQLFPHDKLGDEYYQVVVESIDKEMTGSKELAAQIREGLAKLNESTGGNFVAAGADKQIEVMTKMETSPFFAAMQGKTQYYFYNSQAVWAKLGYEGSSWEKGGYINRGFNDVTWTDN
jgi:hypothetical protein